jgi:predicted phage tail protein
MRRVLVPVGVAFARLTAVAAPWLLAVLFAGMTGFLILLGASVMFLAWLTVIAARDTRTREEYAEWRERWSP